MHKRVRRKKIRKTLFLTGGVAGIVIMILFFVFRDTHRFVDDEGAVDIVIIDDGRSLAIGRTEERTVEDVLRAYDDTIVTEDRVFPPRNERLFSGDVITVEREKKVTVQVDDEEVELRTYRDSLENILMRGGVELTGDDIVKPNKKNIVYTDIEAQIIRVEYREEAETEAIAYKTIKKEDDELSFRKEIVEQRGEEGEKELMYRVAYHDGEEVDRELIETNVTKEPVDEILVQGTYVKLGKKHTGACSWYAHTGTLAAANPWLPMGSYVKVTNQANGKSVIVKINDRGPFVPGRIIDLDKAAFEKIASLGAGVIDVKMEEVLN